jgi:hypothetical protein
MAALAPEAFSVASASFLPPETSAIFFLAVSLSRSSDNGQSEFGYRLDEKFS